MESGRPKVERVPLETYDFTLAGQDESARRPMGYGFVKRGKF
jgi:hypothetical protein